jgi:hypothetical protein
MCFLPAGELPWVGVAAADEKTQGKHAVFGKKVYLCGKFKAMKKGDNNSIMVFSNPDNGLQKDYRFSLEFFVFEENGRQIAYCPSLDISTSGATFNEAVSSFYEMLQLYIECCVENNTLHDDLIAHGWKLHKKQMQPPTFAVLMKKPEMKKLVGGKIGYEKVVAPARIPMVV